MAEQQERIRCRYCGSNNFADTVSCWQCNRPLLDAIKLDQKAAELPVPSSYSLDGSAPPSFLLNQATRNADADKAAIALGLLFPIFGYPFGLAFIMLGDPDKVRVGKLAIWWSTIGLVASLVLSFMVAAPLVNVAKNLLPSNPLSHLNLPTDGSGE